jgi:dihydroflavonol-4-reductase
VTTSTTVARLLRFRPLISPGELHYLLWQVRIDASKAHRELRFTPMPFEEGVRRTFEHLWTTGVLERPSLAG